MSITGRQRSTIGPGHDGGPKRGAVVAADHPKALITHHTPAPSTGMRDQTHAGNIARDGAPKRHLAVPVHSGQVTRSRATGAFHFGGDALSRADPNPANPLGGAPRAKNLTPPQASFGQRSRTGDTLAGGDPGQNHARNVGRGVNHDLGKAIMGAALSAADYNTRQAYGVGVLPDSNSED